MGRTGGILVRQLNYDMALLEGRQVQCTWVPQSIPAQIQRFMPRFTEPSLRNLLATLLCKGPQPSPTRKSLSPAFPNIPFLCYALFFLAHVILPSSTDPSQVLNS